MKEDHEEKTKSSHGSRDQESEPEQGEVSSITLRSVLVGLLVSAFGAASAQIFMFKPIMFHVHSLFVQLACLILGHLAARIPGSKAWNPGPFSMKETTFSSVMSAAASAGAFSVEMIGVRALLFNEQPKVFYSLMVMFSSQMIGYGWAGLLCPLLVFPENVVFPSVLPSVALFHSMYKESNLRQKQVSFFKNALFGISIYELFPTYIAPSLQAISPWCLALPSVPAVSQLFGGSQVGEGLGFLSLSFDWTVLGAAGPLYTPLEAQCNQGVAYIAAILLFSIAHKNNWLGGGHLPFISFSLLDQDGQVYKTSLVINPDGTENTKAIAELGMPYFSTSYILGKAFVCFAASAAFTTAILKKWRTIVSMIRREKVSIDPDREVCRKLKDFPMWGFAAIAAFAVAIAFIALDTGNSGLSNLGLTTAILISFILSLASGFFYGTTGVRLHTSPIVQILGGLLFPGNALGTMFFTIFGASTASQSTLMLKELKLGQYIHMSSFEVVIGQLIGTVVGVFVNFFVMLSIITSQRDALTTPSGNGVFSGLHLSSFEAQSITWGIFGKHLYTHGGIYSFVPYCLLAGFFVPIPLFVLHRAYPRLRLDRFNIALFAGTFYECIQGVTSGYTLKLFLGFMSQFYCKRYHNRWYRNYNYILSAALDGGTQITIVLLTFLFQGGAGVTVNFPHYFLNPANGPRDYCYAETSNRTE